MNNPENKNLSKTYVQRLLPLSLSSVPAIIVSYRSGGILKKCLDSLLNQEEISEIIIVNNGNPPSISSWLDELKSHHEQIQLIHSERNIGFAAGCNLGAAKASGNYLAFINPDCILPKGTLSETLQIFERFPEAWLCGGQLLNPDGTEQRGGRRDILTPWTALVEMTHIYRLFPNHPYFRRFHLYQHKPIHTVEEIPTVSGAFMVTPRRYYERVGGMDDNIFLHIDDSDLCIRILEHGGKVLYCGHIPIIHHQGSSDVSRTFIEWHKTRSTNYYFYKHFLRSYPSWFLLTGALFLWLRFILLLPFFAVSDLPGMLRRLREG